MQNKANLHNALMNVKSMITSKYGGKSAFCRMKNKANSKPNKAKFQIG